MKRIRLALTICTLVALAICGSSTASAQWGTLKGKFVYDAAAPSPTKLNPDKDVQVCGQHQLVDESLVVGSDGGIANIVIFVRTKGVKVHPDYEKAANEKVTCDNKGCRFEPHILPVRLTQTLVLKNSDPIGHNSNLQPIGDTPTNPLIPGGGAAEYKFTKSQNIPVPVTCNIHPWMKGYLMPRDNPYVAISAADGTFELKNLPAEELEFQVWHENPGFLAAQPAWEKGRFKQTIKAGDNDLGTIKVAADLLKKK
jgi:hypothetical protein